jgi:hypothetical protein
MHSPQCLSKVASPPLSMTTSFYKENMKQTKNLITILLTIFVIKASAQAPNTLTRSEKKNGWVLLFDGKTSTNWRSPLSDHFPEKGWKIDSGMMTVDPQKRDVPSGGDIITIKKYKAFDLKFEFRTTDTANSGVKYFVYVDPKYGPLGLEYQILDDDRHPDAKLGRDGDRTEASLYDLIPAAKDKPYKPIGEWNTGEIIVYPNNHVVHYLNGKKVLEYDRMSPEFARLIAISKYNHYQGFGIGTDGYILLQDHGCVVNFRDIKIKEL